MMNSAQVVETSVTVTDNSPFQDYPHPDDHTTHDRILSPLALLPTWRGRTKENQDWKDEKKMYFGKFRKTFHRKYFVAVYR